MKILLAVDSLARGGMERRVLELIKGLGEYQDVNLKLVVFSETIEYPEIYDWNIPVILLKRVPKRNPLVFYRFYKLCKQWKPDLIHSWGTMSAIWAIPASQFLRIKLINGNIVDAPVNMSFFDKRLFRARLTYPFSSRIIGNSKAGLKAYRVPKKKGICIHNGIDPHRVLHLKKPSEVRQELNIQTENVIGMVGSFTGRKDFKTFIKAGLVLLDQRKDITLVAVGEGPDLPRHEQLIPAKYTTHFRFPGIRTDVEDIINIFDIGVLATNTREHGEGISNVILEYMALAKPVVATQGGGTPEIVIHQQTGILVPSYSFQDMAHALNYLLDNKKEAATMGSVGLETVHGKFSLSKMTENYVDLYKTCI